MANLLAPQSLDGVQFRSLRRGIESGGDAAHDQRSDSQRRRPGYQPGRVEAGYLVGEELLQQPHKAGGNGNADQSADAGEQQSFPEELRDDAALSGSHRLEDTNLASPFGDGDQHDVDDAYRAQAQGDDAHAAQKNIHGVEDDS